MSQQIEIEEMIIKHKRRLQKLEEKKTTLGINTPPEILTEIEDIEAELEKLETELQKLAINAQTSPEQNQYPNKSDITQGTASLFTQFIANLLALGILTYLFYGKVVVRCEPNWVSASSSAIIAVVVFHIAWHYFYPVFTLSGKFSSLGFEIDLKSLLTLLDIFHPKQLSTFVLWGVALILIPSAAIIGYSNLSPFVLEDPIPIIEDFAVTHLNKQKSVVLAGDTVEIVPDEQILIEATVLQQASLQCYWSTTNGRLQLPLQPANRCAVLYSPKFGFKQDTLVVLTQSLCQKKQTFAGVHISIIETPP